MRRAWLFFVLVACARSARPNHVERPEKHGNERLLDERSEARAADSHSGLRRADVDRFLDRGPQPFLQEVEVEAVLEKGKFVGWRVVSFFRGDERFAGVDLEAGDVVVAVNGRSIVRPEDLWAEWERLRTAHTLVVEILRSGEKRTLEYAITE